MKISRNVTMRRAKTKALRKKLLYTKSHLYLKTLPPQDLQLLILKPPSWFKFFVF